MEYLAGGLRLVVSDEEVQSSVDRALRRHFSLHPAFLLNVEMYYGVAVCVFFSVCLSLGYPSPRKHSLHTCISTASNWRSHVLMVLKWHQHRRKQPHLVPQHDVQRPSKAPARQIRFSLFRLPPSCQIVQLMVLQSVRRPNRQVRQCGRQSLRELLFPRYPTLLRRPQFPARHLLQA